MFNQGQKNEQRYHLTTSLMACYTVPTRPWLHTKTRRCCGDLSPFSLRFPTRSYASLVHGVFFITHYLSSIRRVRRCKMFAKPLYSPSQDATNSSEGLHHVLAGLNHSPKQVRTSQLRVAPSAPAPHGIVWRHRYNSGYRQRCPPRGHPISKMTPY